MVLIYLVGECLCPSLEDGVGGVLEIKCIPKKKIYYCNIVSPFPNKLEAIV